MDFFFCCMKRDKPHISQNKPSKDNLYNFVINEKLQNKKNVQNKQGEDSVTNTNAEENSNMSVDINEKEILKPHLNSPQNLFIRRFDIFPEIDSETEDHFEYLFYERGLNEVWEIETNKEDIKIWSKMVILFF